jgi:hypothetical protein
MRRGDRHVNLERNILSEKTEANANGTNNVETLLRQIQAQLTAGKSGLDKLAPDFVKAWAECANVVKNSNNPHFGSDYADLSAVLDVVKPAFAKYNLALYQAPGPMNGDKVTVISLVIHASGQSLGPVTTELPIGGKLTAQAAGSAITYGRRYTAQSVAGIAPVDDDGNTASVPPPRPRTGSLDTTTNPEEAKELIKSKKKTKEPDKEPEEGGGLSYAEERDALIAKIAAIAVSKDMNKLAASAALEELKDAVREIEDAEVSNAFVAKRKEVRASKSEGK